MLMRFLGIGPGHHSILTLIHHKFTDARSALTNEAPPTQQIDDIPELPPTITLPEVEPPEDELDVVVDDEAEVDDDVDDDDDDDANGGHVDSQCVDIDEVAEGELEREFEDAQVDVAAIDDVHARV